MEPKEVKLNRLFQTNGRTLILPYDQGLEHGPRDFFQATFARDPMHVIEIAKKAKYNAVVMHIGNARRYFKDIYGEVPLILKVNGKTEIPPDDEPLSTLTASVNDALSLSAIAIGYTLYVGSARQDEDIEQFSEIREEAHRYGLPVIVWSYPRGEDIKEKGGKDSLYAIEYAGRVAAELGADMVKLNVPSLKKNDKIPEPYRSYDIGLSDAIKQIIASTGGVPVIFAGGEMVSDNDLIRKAEVCIKAGASGLIFGRNIWQRPLKEAVGITGKIKEIIKG
ncbi:MAG: fructose-bisphosphate aldolase [Proteobacteria bacterium]|nr:fructose-bisphosphate aldolase [Pseudomonadota bacterium]